MGLNNPAAGASYAPEFQSSALPWVTSSTATSTAKEWDFNYVTRFVGINNGPSGSIAVGFTLNGVNGGNRVVIQAGSSVLFEWRCTKLFVKSESGGGAYSLAVGLTTIPSGNFPLLTGSFPDGTNWDGVG